MKNATSYELRNGLQENSPTHKNVMNKVETLAKALDQNSLKYDLDKLDSEVDNMKTYLSLIEAAGQLCSLGRASLIQHS